MGLFLLSACALTQKQVQSNTYSQGWALGGGVLAAVCAVDPVPLHQLIGRRVCPVVVSCLQLGVLQSTGSN